ncbi:DUF3833 domain-containing protein [Pseudodesulfovibrio sp.]|nr:DUF3833 domain-containing protein [Pseudodesulfovibrio sp.]
MVCTTQISAKKNALGGAPLVLENFFAGELRAHGVILTRGGKVRRSFNAIMRGAWEEKGGTLQGVLTEDFVFNDGEKILRRWEFTKTGDGQYTGTASDVEGTALLATSGNALRMDYALVVPVSGKTFVVNVEDWLWLMEPDVIVNKSTMCKWSFRVGEIITTIVRDK